MTSLRERFEADSQEFGLGPFVVAGLLLVPLAGGLALAAARTDLDAFRGLTKEDGPIEWLQVVAFLGTAAFSALAALRLHRHGHRIAALVFLGLAAACVVISGEEVAWGQRLLAIEVPEAIVEINDQDELTVHNIGFLLYVFNLGMLATAAYGALSPYVVDRLGERVPDWWRYYLVPPMALVTAFGLAGVFRIVRLTIVRHSGFTITKWGEWTELCLAAALMIFAALAAQRAAKGLGPVQSSRRLASD